MDGQVDSVHTFFIRDVLGAGRSDNGSIRTVLSDRRTDGGILCGDCNTCVCTVWFCIQLQGMDLKGGGAMGCIFRDHSFCRGLGNSGKRSDTVHALFCVGVFDPVISIPEKYSSKTCIAAGASMCGGADDGNAECL